MSRRYRRPVALLLLAILTGGSATVWAQAPPNRPPLQRYEPPKEPALHGQQELRKGAEDLRSGANPMPEVVKTIGPGLFQIGTIRLDLNARQARVPGRINMTRGIIEYFAVMEQRGKLHESVLALDVQPSLLQFALILLGLEAGELAPGDAATRTPPRLVKSGDAITLSVEWDQAGKTERVPAEALIFNRETQKPMTGNAWNFTGSFFVGTRFAADLTGSIIATRLDYRAMINASHQIGNPYRGPNSGYEVNTATVPPLDTPVRLVFEAARPN